MFEAVRHSIQELEDVIREVTPQCIAKHVTRFSRIIILWKNYHHNKVNSLKKSH